MLSLFLAFLSGPLWAQTEKPYNPSLDGQKQINDAVIQAKQEGKHVFMMIGGNW